MTNKTILKRCPFCGGRAELIITDKCAITVACRGCGVSVGYYSNAERAVEIWNMRNAKNTFNGGKIKMILKTLSEYQKEIERVQAAIDSTDSEYLRNDYGKYIKKLKREAIKIIKGI